MGLKLIAFHVKNEGVIDLFWSFDVANKIEIRNLTPLFSGKEYEAMVVDNKKMGNS